MRRIRQIYVLLLMTSLVLLAGCMDGGGGFPLDQMVRHPLIQVIIGVIVLWIVFRRR